MNLTPEAITRAKRILTDLPFFAKNFLKIRTKNNGIQPFQFNDAQLYVHKEIEAQKKELGKVRIIIVKGRQQGCSTYIAARFYHIVTTARGCKAFILGHREDATNNLYKLVLRFQNLMDQYFKPRITISNAKSLVFGDLDSGYSLGTSGGGTVGRSDTIQLLHMSEAAYYENTEELSSGIMQTVPDGDNTEIILESTANGMGNFFHQMAINAIEGRNGYKLIFLPWFMQKEYTTKVNKLTLSNEDLAYKDLFNLTDEQMQWRQEKIATLMGGIEQFRQEYPATIQEAFEVSTENKIISSAVVLEARKSTIEIDHHIPLIIGCDPAHEGKDRTAIVFRRGRYQYKSEVYRKWNTTQITGRLVQIIKQYHPAKIFIDKGYNPGIYDRLIELGYADIVIGVHFGQRPDEPDRFLNKRAEMWCRAKEWLEDQPCRIEDYNDMHLELCAVGKLPPTSRGLIVLEKKETIKKNIGVSTDIADAFVLTFAFFIALFDDVKRMQEQYKTIDETRNRITGY